VRVVVDASVVVKWLFADPQREEFTQRATALMGGVVQGRVLAVQPVHWLTEVASVLARATPGQAEKDVGLLCALSLPVSDGPEILQRACRLAIELEHHLFDTLYHAVALETDSVLVTADAQYLNKAGKLGQILHLADWVPAE
jgi:predicted nucleic acid-binding protein